MNIATFLERFRYLKLGGKVAEETFGFERYLNQKFYNTSEWKRVRDIVIARDSGCDLGIEDRPIFGKVIIHHLNPISAKDIIHRDMDILNPDYLICCSYDTHQAIHFGSEDLLILDPIERKPYDTCPWRNQ
jgi:hypothetical protein